jgi:hypothetical protein
MYPSSYAETFEMRERRYLVATLLHDAWLPRALVGDLALAEQKATYWSEIYGAPRTRISEVWVPGRPQKAPEPQAPPTFARSFTQKPAAVEISLAPARRAHPRRRWTDRLARLDRPLDPFYAKALIDTFLLYVGTQIAFRMLEILKFGSLTLV